MNSYSGMHLFTIRIVGGCLILALLTNTVGCYQYRQIPVTTIPEPKTGKSDKTPVTIDELLPTLVASKARVKVVLRDNRTIKGQVVDFRDPYLHVKDGKQLHEIDKSEITEVHSHGLDIVETVQWSLGIIVTPLVIYGICLIAVGALGLLIPDTP